MKKLIPLCIAASFLFASCAVTYDKPTAIEPVTSVTMKAETAAILRAAKQTLALDGYQITTLDDSAGIIITAPRPVKITPEQADCGTTMGIDYLLDKRTATRAAINIVVVDRQMTVKAIIAAEYKPGDVVQDITLQCVSRGVIEKDIANRIGATTG